MPSPGLIARVITQCRECMEVLKRRFPRINNKQNCKLRSLILKLITSSPLTRKCNSVDSLRREGPSLSLISRNSRVLHGIMFVSPLCPENRRVNVENKRRRPWKLSLSSSSKRTGGLEVYLHSLLTSALDGTESSPLHTCRSVHYHSDTRLGWPQYSVWTLRSVEGLLPLSAL